MSKTNEPCAAAMLVRAQGEQIGSIDVLEYMRRKGIVEGEDRNGESAGGAKGFPGFCR